MSKYKEQVSNVEFDEMRKLADEVCKDKGLHPVWISSDQLPGYKIMSDRNTPEQYRNDTGSVVWEVGKDAPEFIKDEDGE